MKALKVGRAMLLTLAVMLVIGVESTVPKDVFLPFQALHDGVFFLVRVQLRASSSFEEIEVNLPVIVAQGALWRMGKEACQGC